MNDSLEVTAREMVAGLAWHHCLTDEQRAVWQDKGAALTGDRNAHSAWLALKAERPQTAQRMVDNANPAEVAFVAQLILRMD
ncbi:hypothetical protein LMG31506_05779 [Cupriavidus yeoncheonensis]|uniref:Uncharacterized protein n=1 Tax=Cupriavidus yeoncheonensis TaxID=1462994 RepID=A0A916IZU1_9BURK|nr:hypothetical protein [Cupriavidus yeoncheonensis]CAG2156674.1 hypothetical protein LMG31506_05779 [Cupriavidus yeoncheonensis]